MNTKVQERPVFVYGTLRKGGTANHIMDGARWHSQTKTEVGYRLAKMDDLPGMIYTGDLSQVVGDLYYLTPDQLKRLDQFEDVRYRKGFVTIVGGRQARAYLLPSFNGEVDQSDWT